jgi:predicted transcriptional regulator
MLMENYELKEKLVNDEMSFGFSFVDLMASVKDVSKLITKANATVLFKDLINQEYMITKYDLIEAVS